VSARELAPPRAPAPTGSLRLLSGIGDGPSLGAHTQRWGDAPAIRGERARRELRALVAASGLTGRGGGAFPTARKLEAVLARGGTPVVVANGVEAEPASGKDKVLLAYSPHLVLDGASLAAQAIGAREAVIAAARPAARAAVEAAVAERRREGLDRGVHLRVAAVPERFVAGEESALVRCLDGGPAKPTFGARPFEHGLGGAPTLVQNAETLAHLALIARFGPGWFRSVGTAEEPGSLLVTLSGAVRSSGVYEVAVGTPLEVLLAQAGGPTEAIGAVLVGGYFGAWVPAAAALPSPISHAGLLPHGAAPGAGAIVVLPASVCGIAETARVARWLAGESAGQCGPCVHGLAAIAGDLDDIAAGRDGVAARERLERRLGLVPGRGACRHPDGAVRFVASALRVFADELERHVRHGSCSAASRPNVLPLPAGPRERA
jgi:NADH:ubiquinone oxidoreductase subunit F (NADH-binding)